MNETERQPSDPRKREEHRSDGRETSDGANDRRGRLGTDDDSNVLRSDLVGCGRRGVLRGLGAAATVLVGLPGITGLATADDSLSREIVITNENDDDEELAYEFAVSGSVEKATDPQGDRVAQNTASGIVRGWKDGYDYSGEITRFEYDGEAIVLLDGAAVDPDSLGNEPIDDASADDDSTDGDDESDNNDDEATGDFETVTVPAGETYTRRVESGEALENVRFDVSAEGSHVDIDCRGDGWVLRNVGVSGTSTYPEKNQVIRVNCDGEGLIENVYLGDGSDDGCHDTGIFVGRESEGRLTIRNVNVQAWADNGIYASAPGHATKSHGGCEVVIENCYGRNNNTANFRIGSDGSVVRRCVSIVDGDVPAKIGPDGEAKHNGRPVWVTEGGDCAIEDCDLVSTSSDGDHCVVKGERDVGGTVRVDDCRLTPREKRWRTNHGEIVPQEVSYPDESEATTAVPDGVPRAAEEAASGGANG